MWVKCAEEYPLSLNGYTVDERSGDLPSPFRSFQVRDSTWTQLWRECSRNIVEEVTASFDQDAISYQTKGQRSSGSIIAMHSVFLYFFERSAWH